MLKMLNASKIDCAMYITVQTGYFLTELYKFSLDASASVLIVYFIFVPWSDNFGNVRVSLLDNIYP